MPDSREKKAWSGAEFAATAEVVRDSGSSVTALGEQRQRQGLSLHPHVDPKTHDGKRESFNVMVPQPNETFRLEFGIAMPLRSGLDMTGSMGGNIDIAFEVMPEIQRLLVQGDDAPLGRYNAQFATATIEDEVDHYAYLHSEFEIDNRIEEQMRQFAPTRHGGDAPEEYLLHLYYADRIVTSLAGYGLKGYDFIVGDEIGRPYLTPSLVVKALGKPYLQSEVDRFELAARALAKWHLFFLQVENRPYTTTWWSELIGRERVVILPKTQDIAFVQAAIVGLTEGTLDLQTAGDFLTDIGRVEKARAAKIVRAVSHIPVRGQAQLPNFANIPLAGTIFAHRDDIWPIKTGDGASTPAAEPISWQL